MAVRKLLGGTGLEMSGMDRAVLQRILSGTDRGVSLWAQANYSSSLDLDIH